MSHLDKQRLESDGQTHSADKSTDEPAGTYPANKRRGGSCYPNTVETVEVRPDVDGYHDILLLDESGRIVYTHNRAAYRIRAALEGDYGYDIVVRGTA